MSRCSISGDLGQPLHFVPSRLRRYGVSASFAGSPPC